MASLTTLQDLFVKELRDTYDAEKQISKALPKMIKHAHREDLRSAFENHHQETLAQIDRLEQAFEQLDLRAKGVRCQGMAGIIEEGSDMLGEKGDEAVLDAGLIAAAQKVEHYEIASYGTLVTYARTLGHTRVAELLAQTLEEEKSTDQRLSRLAEAGPNREAASQAPQSRRA
jgi:ferritin-like metal-binding protein YciE